MSSTRSRRVIAAAVAAIVGATVFAVSTAPGGAASGTAVFLVGSSDLKPGDRVAKSVLEGLGLAVQIETPDTLTKSDLDGKALGVVSDTVFREANLIRNVFFNAVIPVVAWENDTFDKMGFAAPQDANDLHESDTVVFTASHPITTGLSGPVKVYKAPGTLGRTTPTGDVQVLAKLPDGRPALVVLEKGGKGTDGVVNKARRVGLYMEDGGTGKLTDPALGVLRRAFQWALGAPTGGGPTTSTPGRDRTPDERFAQALFIDFLDRVGSSPELTSIAQRLAAGTPRPGIVTEFGSSDEWMGALVDRFYQSTLGRAADPGGRAYWVGVLRSGRSPASVAAEFYASTEYFNRTGGTKRGWVADLYNELLGRPADEGGLQFWTDRTADVGRVNVAAEFYGSLESRRARVTGLYRALLHRDPDGGGREYWAGILTNGRDIDLAVNLASSAEYYQRASTRPETNV